MSIPPPPPLRPPPDPAQQTQELLKFLREENEANRKAVREDAAASRDLLLSTTKIVAIPVAVALSIGAWLGYKSIGDLKDTLEQQAKSTTQVEIGKMQDNIHKRLTEQFETPALQKMVRDTAAEYTKTQAEPLIKSEVSARVAEAVRNSVGSAVKTQIQPAIEKVKTVSDLQGLILRMDNDDANAFDDLEALSMAKTENDEIDRLMKTAVNNVRAAHDGMPNFPSPLAGC